MERGNWRDLPHGNVPSDFERCWYWQGDEQHWLNLQQATERYVMVMRGLYEYFFRHRPTDRRLFAT
jgi:hypothetical protein